MRFPSLRSGCLIVVIAAVLGLVWFYVSLKQAYGPQTSPSGPVSDSRPLTEFAAFPVYWLGIEYRGLPLTGLRINPPKGVRNYNIVQLTYGYCKTRGGFDGGGCNPPIIIEQPPCSISSNFYGPGSDGTTGYVWRKEVGVYVQTTSPAPAAKWQIVSELALANTASFPAEPLVDTAAFRPSLQACSAPATQQPSATPVNQSQ